SKHPCSLGEIILGINPGVNGFFVIFLLFLDNAQVEKRFLWKMTIWKAPAAPELGTSPKMQFTL
ncbi:MAG: hypothetical protein SO002_09245, partial [Candidatus Faecousia sp.]|nr:hypothetical protein [Candidatus Faecousia sp.]